MTVNIIDLVDGNAWEGGADGYIIKAGQGELEYPWRDFVTFAEAEGKPWGLYWLCDARYSAEQHKAAIKSAFPNGYFGALGLWLDIEKPLLSMTDAQYRRLPYAYYKTIESIWRGIFYQWGFYAGWYFSPGSWDLICSAMPKILQDEIAAKCDLWIANYGALTPSMRGSWVNWVMWQWRAEPDYNHVDSIWWANVSHETPPTPEPQGETMYTGKVKDTCTPYLIVRDINGVDIGHINPGIPVTGDTVGFVATLAARAPSWMHILTPTSGYVASQYLDYSGVDDPKPVSKAIHVTLNDDRDGSIWSGDLTQQ